MTTAAVHPTEFERCACALLSEQYPGLSAVEGGHDFGRDADIYFASGSADPASRGRLLATTGDPVVNLRTGLKRMREEGLRVDVVVLACLGEVDAGKRRELDAVCSRAGLDAPHVYAHDWFVAALVQDPHWRHRLLGIHGELGALLDEPLARLEQATAQPALTGRATDLAAVEELIRQGRDLLLTGVPGVGKTRLATELPGNVKFLESVEPSVLVDDLVLTQPDAVVVDDAHLRLAQLRDLRRARQQQGLSFSIIATTWPDRVEEVREQLPNGSVIAVPLLELADVDAIVRSVGVTGVRARTVVLHQAEGRPGWALALCELLVTGHGVDVATGRAHADSVERFLRRATQSEVALDLVACIAALGRVDTETVHLLAPVVGTPPAEAVALLEGVARNGLVEQTTGSWSLQPALRAPLVARWFFSDAPRRPWSTLQRAFPDHELAMVRTTIAAAQTGSQAAAREAERWARSLPDTATWSADVLAAFGERATLSEDAARQAVAAASVILRGPREVERVSGYTYDPLGEGARGVLRRVVRQWALPEAVSALLDLATTDARPRPQTSEHPLRVLADLAQHVDPDYGTAVQVRERLFDAALAWLAEADDDAAERRWLVVAELLAAVLAVDVSGSWLDPGQPHMFTLQRGVESSANLQRILSLWPSVDQALQADYRRAIPQCPPPALAHLLELAGQWLQLGDGFSMGGGSIDEGQREVGASGGRSMLKSLRAPVQAVPGLALKAQRLLEDLERRGRQSSSPPPTFQVEPDLLDLVGGLRPYHREDIDEELREQAEARERLACRLVALGPDAGTSRFDELFAQMRLVDDHSEGQPVAWAMRPHLADPAAWYHAATDAGSATLAHAALAQCLAGAVPLPRSAVAGALQDPQLRGAIISAAVERRHVDAITEVVIADMQVQDVWTLNRLFVRDQADDVLHLLLRHPVRAVAGAAAFGFAVGQRHGPLLPEQWRPEWRAAVRALTPEELDQHNQWRAGELLSHLVDHDPDLVEEWFLRRLDDQQAWQAWWGHTSDEVEQAFSRLPRPHRERIARRCGGRDGTRVDVLVHLVGHDRQLAERLLDEGALTLRDLLTVVHTRRDEVFETIGPLLLERGADPADIAHSAGWTSSWTGYESAVHAATYEYFAQLAERVPTLAPVAAAGCAQQAEYQRTAEEEERQERIRGR